MNNTSTTSAPVLSERSTHLLDRIRTIHASIGDGLNDDEFTRLLQKTALPEESGFGFLSYCDRTALLSVPEQDAADWYPEKGWIVPAKEKQVRAIAEKYGLSVCVPPDAIYTCPDLPVPHHHFELSNRMETIIVIHPFYMKVRLFATSDPTRQTRCAMRPLQLGPNLLPHLAELYGG